MDKRQILAEFEQQLETEVAQQKTSLETTCKAVWDAPCRMESRYDSTKTEMG